jgi:hypothetical protein
MSQLGDLADEEGLLEGTIDWRNPPLSTDSSRCYCILETVFHVSRCFGCSESQAEATLVVVKAHIMRMLHRLSYLPWLLVLVLAVLVVVRFGRRCLGWFGVVVFNWLRDLSLSLSRL